MASKAPRTGIRKMPCSGLFYPNLAVQPYPWEILYAELIIKPLDLMKKVKFSNILRQMCWLCGSWNLDSCMFWIFPQFWPIGFLEQSLCYRVTQSLSYANMSTMNKCTRNLWSLKCIAYYENQPFWVTYLKCVHFETK